MTASAGEVSVNARTPTRPVSVIWYERLAWAAIAVGLASAVANPATLVKFYNRYPVGYPIEIACFVLFELLWVWLIARKRKNWARWISLVVTLIGVPSTIWGFDERFRVNALATVILCASVALSMISVFFLFRRDASEWFARRPVVPDLHQPS